MKVRPHVIASLAGPEPNAEQLEALQKLVNKVGVTVLEDLFGGSQHLLYHAPGRSSAAGAISFAPLSHGGTT